MKDIIYSMGVLVAMLCAGASAMNGKAVSIVGRVDGQFGVGNSHPIGNTKRLVVFTIAGDAVTRCDTILRGDFTRSVFSYDGTRIAFVRGGTLSVINPDGTGLRDVALTNGSGSEEEENHVDWPYGDWIYYRRMDLQNEVWRVNATGTAVMSKVCDFDPYDIGFVRFARFQLTADGSRAALQQLDWTGKMPFGSGAVFALPFPPGNNNPLLAYSDPTNGSPYVTGDCNPAISASGEYFWHFSGWHGDMYCARIDWAAKTSTENYTVGSNSNGSMSLGNDVGSWGADVSGMQQFDYPRASRNSDKWVLVVGSFGNGHFWADAGNQLVINWIDRKAINTTQIKSPSMWYAEPGDLWVDGGSSAAGKYENINGNWIAVNPTGAIVEFSATGTNPYQVTMAAQPTGCQIYYTTNGSEPTQSSTLYSGTFQLTVPGDQSITMKAKAFKSGVTASRTVSKRFLPFVGIGTGALAKVWRDLPGGNISDLTSSPRYPNSPNETYRGSDLSATGYGGYGSIDMGVQITGYIIPPMTGSYSFSIDQWHGASSFKLSTSESAAGLVTLATEDRQEHFTTPAVTLTAGHWYYFEMLRKKGDDDANQMSMSWQMPWGEWEGIYTNRLAPPDSAHSPTVVKQNPSAPGLTTQYHFTRTVVYNISGKAVADLSSPIDLLSTRLPSGTYIVKQLDGNGHATVRRMAIRRTGALTELAR